jgi:hypothetical protein
MVDAYLDWKADLHTCGRPMSESLRLLGRDDPEYVVATLECVACEELEKHRAARSKVDAKSYENSGVNPSVWRLERVELMAEARANFEQQRQDQQARERR